MELKNYARSSLPLKNLKYTSDQIEKRYEKKDSLKIETFNVNRYMAKKINSVERMTRLCKKTIP
jgi:hypothetical protein